MAKKGKRIKLSDDLPSMAKATVKHLNPIAAPMRAAIAVVKAVRGHTLKDDHNSLPNYASGLKRNR